MRKIVEFFHTFYCMMFHAAHWSRCSKHRLRCELCGREYEVDL